MVMKGICFIIFLLPSLIGNSMQVGKEAGSCPYEYDSLARMKVYTFVDKQPEYPGGSPALLNFIAKNFHYPEQDVFQASFQIQFVIDEHGSVLAARIKGKKQGELTLAEQELLKVIYKMPKWKIGKCEGRKVPVKISLPLYL